jgi:hypothetical protein
LPETSSVRWNTTRLPLTRLKFDPFAGLYSHVPDVL